MPKKFYILFVARGDDGQLRKIPIPTRYLYVLAFGALVGLLGLTGMASTYVRMLLKVSSYNQLRAEREDLKNRYTHLEQVSQERDIQVASLGSLASEIGARRNDPNARRGASFGSSAYFDTRRIDSLLLHQVGLRVGRTLGR